MFRTESELIRGLFDAINRAEYSSKNTQEKPKPLTKEEELEIEKYRDIDGFINLKSVKNPKDVTRIFDIVDRKNHLEELENGKTLKDSIIDTIKDVLSKSIQNGTDFVATVSPDGKLTIKSKDDLIHVDESCKGEEPENNEETEIVDETVAELPENNDYSVDDVFGEKTIKDYDNEEAMVMLDDVSGNYHPLYYNAVRHICETQYFPKNGVYTFDEVRPEECNVVILLPNVWGKITSEFVEIYDKFLKDGGKLFIINPEGFSCEEIKEPARLWDFEMSIIQEEMNR